jgi:hypothetical protein
MKLKLWPITGIGYLYSGLGKFTSDLTNYFTWCKTNNNDPILDLYPEGYNLHTAETYDAILAIAKACGFNETDITLVTGDMSAEYHCKVIKHTPYFLDKASVYAQENNIEFTHYTAKHFGHFIGRMTWDRCAMHSYIKNRYADISYYSMHGFANVEKSLSDIIVNLKNTGHYNNQEIKQIVSDTLDTPLQNLDPFNAIKTSPNWPDDIEPLQMTYQQTFVDIMHETDTSDENCFITEKTVRPMLFKRPFLAMCGTNYLEKLRQLGFQTFDKWFDEKYDNLDSKSKFIGIQKRMQNIADMDQSARKNMLKEMQSVLEHNFEHVANKGYEKHLHKFNVSVWDDSKIKYYEN